MKYEEKRKVNCWLCGGEMFYRGDERFLPESQIVKRNPPDEWGPPRAVHDDCLDFARLALEKEGHPGH